MKRYWPNIKQHSWILLLCFGIATVVGIVIAKIIPSTYSVNALIFVNQGAPGTILPGVALSKNNVDAANNYAAEILSRSVMEYVYEHNPDLKEHHLKPEDLLLDVTDAPSTTSGEIIITATVANPDDTILLANAVATGFEQYITDQAAQQLSLMRSSLADQITNLNAQRANDEDTMRAQGNNASPDYIFANKDLQQVNIRLNAVQQQLNQLPTSVRGNVFLMQQAKPTDISTSSKTTLVIPIVAAVGLLLGIMLLLLVIYRDERVYGEDRVREKLGMAYLGALSRHKDLKAHPTQTKAFIQQQLVDLRLSLGLAAIISGEQRAPKGAALLVTSPQDGEGKTTVAAGLAAAIARGGGTVIVIDGNLKKSSTHLTFGMGVAGTGLAGWLNSSGRESIDDVMQRSSVPGLWVLPVGALVEDSASLLEQRLPTLLSQLRKKADLIIIDGPALLNGAEAGLLAKMVDGVALVIDFRRDKMKFLLQVKELLATMPSLPVGVIMNQAPRRRNNAYFAVALPEPAPPEQEAPLATAVSDGNGRHGRKLEPALVTAL